MKFDAHVSNVGFILYLYYMVSQDLEKQIYEFCPTFFMLQSHLHTPRDRLTDIMNSYLLLICISFVPATVSICATLPLWFSKHMQNRIIRLSGLALLSLIMAGGLLLAFACQNPWFGLSCIAVSSINIPLFRHYELLLSTLRCSKCHHISLHLCSPSTRIPTS